MSDDPFDPAALVAAIRQMSASALAAAWAKRDAETWSTSRDVHAATARRWLSLGEPFSAYDVVQEALALWPDDPALLTLSALALARCGAAGSANAILRALYERGARDEETIGVFARSYKDLWLESGGAQDSEHLAHCADLYLEAFRAHGGIWTGVNAATTALLRGDVATAVALAGEVQKTCLETMANGGAQDYWLLATMGEAALILGDVGDAGTWYTRAARVRARGYGDLASTRRNAALVARARAMDPAILDEWLPPPKVMIATGHMIDRAGSAAIRFAPGVADEIGARLRRIIAESGATIGYASAACGADLLFLEAMADAGGETHIVLPHAPDIFVESSVASAQGDAWRPRFDRALARATSVTVASDDLTSDMSYAYANLLIYGLASARARELGGTLDAVAVWDGGAGGLGGTASALGAWRAAGLAVRVVSPVSLEESSLLGALRPRGALSSLPNPVDARPTAGESALVAILFADAVGFSKLLDRQIPRFVDHFLGTVAHLIEELGAAPLVRNTWGDGLYFVFADPQSAGTFALALRDRVAATAWGAFDLPSDLALRIGLHSGPAFAVHDPVIDELGFTGSHVSRAARIEPITPPGQIYASQAFAAVSEAAGVTGYRCDYVGQTPLAKKYGVFPTYRLRRV